MHITWMTSPRALAAAISLTLAGCASPPPVAWPGPLVPGADEVWLSTLAARGVQIYACRGDGAAPAWVFVAPEAQLFDAAGRAAGTHGAGPFWQAVDGSRVVGTVLARADAPAADAIPWLLLGTRAEGPTGSFSRVTRIRRVNTVAGIAPRSGCTPDTLGTLARVPYTADYFLYTQR